MKYAICYVSTVSRDVDDTMVENLMDKTLQNNLEEGIKGILLFSEGNFLQVLEGEKTSLLKLYSKIEQDPRHKNVIQIMGKEISHGGYDSYETRIIEKESTYDAPELLKEYMKTIEGMDYPVKQTIKNILKVFLKTRPSVN